MIRFCSCIRLFSSVYLALVSYLCLDNLSCGHAPKVRALRVWLGRGRRTPRKLRHYIGSMDWPDWAKRLSLIRSASYSRTGLPFSSFFCSLQLNSKNSKLLITTLCRDLSELFKFYATNVLPILEADSKFVDASLCFQIDKLLAKLCQASLAQREDLQPPIVIVDALGKTTVGPSFWKSCFAF